MKLYATITSERATKGQGGNDYLDIDIFCGSADNSVTLAKLTVRPSENDGYILVDHTDEVLAELTKEQLKAPTKGKRQKGELKQQDARDVDGHGLEIA